MAVIWDVRPAIAAAFFVVYVAVEGVYMSSLMNKVVLDGWVPFSITAFFLVITVSWTYGRKKKSEYEVGHMISGNKLAVLVTRRLSVTSVLPGERFLVAAEEGVPPGVHRSVVQYGYMDKQDMEGEEFLESVLDALKEIARTAEEAAMMDRACRSRVSAVIGRTILTASGGNQRHGWFRRFVVNHMYRFLQKNINSGVSNLKLDNDKTM
ncbi:hypothetical protein VPH35_047210 [Triticum aestivum]